MRRIEELFAEYMRIRQEGLTMLEAMEAMDYLHPITLCRLKKMIDGNSQPVAIIPQEDNNDRKEEAP